MEAQNRDLEKLHAPSTTLSTSTKGHLSTQPPEKGAIGIAFLVWLFGGGLGLAILVFLLLKIF